VIDGYSASEAIAKTEQKSSEAIDPKNCYCHFWLDVPMDKSGMNPYQALINFNTDKGKQKKLKKSRKDDIVKIQVAAANEDFQNPPMLLYNCSRSAKTFIHSDVEGYGTIRSLIEEGGADGMLGKTGGTKKYFFCQIRKREGVVSVNISTEVPTQSW